ncbi:unnamed protein product, partial [Didymodactylos carnosus]
IIMFNEYFVTNSEPLVYNSPRSDVRYHPYGNSRSYSSPNNNLNNYMSSNYQSPADFDTSFQFDGPFPHDPDSYPIYPYDYTLWSPNGGPRCFKRRVSANKKERRRTQSINTAFSDLRGCIPNVPPDTKLSKIKTLKLATKYIEYLMDILSKDDPSIMPSAFKADISKTRKDHREIKYDSDLSPRKSRGRTGWPQDVWASELNSRNENIHHHHQSSDPMTITTTIPNGYGSVCSNSNSPTLSHSSSSTNLSINKNLSPNSIPQQHSPKKKMSHRISSNSGGVLKNHSSTVTKISLRNERLTSEKLRMTLIDIKPMYSSQKNIG